MEEKAKLEALLQALALKGDKKKKKKAPLQERLSDPLYVALKGYTPLITALRLNAWPLCEFIAQTDVAKGQSLDVVDAKGFTALWYAVKSRLTPDPVVTALFRAGADPFLPSQNKKTTLSPFQLALVGEDIGRADLLWKLSIERWSIEECREKLLSREKFPEGMLEALKANPRDKVILKTAMAMTDLPYFPAEMALAGKLHSFRWILKALDGDILRILGEPELVAVLSPFVAALRTGNHQVAWACLAALLEQRPDLASNRTEIARMLGCDAVITDDVLREKAIHLAAYKSDIDFLQLLVDFLKIPVDSPSSEGTTALTSALCNGSDRSVQYLLSHGASTLLLHEGEMLGTLKDKLMVHVARQLTAVHKEQLEAKMSSPHPTEEVD